VCEGFRAPADQEPGQADRRNGRVSTRGALVLNRLPEPVAGCEVMWDSLADGAGSDARVLRPLVAEADSLDAVEPAVWSHTTVGSNGCLSCWSRGGSS
jgi:hypothetical protein